MQKQQTNDPALHQQSQIFFGGGASTFPFLLIPETAFTFAFPSKRFLFPFNGNSMGPSYLRRADADRRQTDAVGARPRRRRLGGRAVRRRPVDDHYRPVRHARAVAASLRVDRCR